MGVFNFKKNKNVVVSTKTMTVDEYIKAIERPILDAWSDPVLMEKTGIKDLFADNIKITKKMSAEDIFECMKRTNRMSIEGAEISTKFDEEARPYHEDSFEKRKMAAATGIGSMSNYDNEFFSADTILRITNDVCGNRENIEVGPTPAAEALFNILVKEINSLKIIKNIMFDSIMITAGTSFATMTGYKK